MPSLESNTEAFRVFLASQNLTIFSEQAINHGYQIIVTDGAARNPVNFFTTGRIVVQGKDAGLKTKLTEWANLRQANADHPSLSSNDTNQAGPISRNSRYTVSPAKFDLIREEVIERLNAQVNYKTLSQGAEVYRAEIHRGNERVIVTQFQTGTLFVQGRTSQLFDEVCEALDKRLIQSFADRAARYLPEESANSARQYLESTTAENDAWVWVQKELGQDVFDFLWPHDQQTIVSGAGILLALRETGRQLAEFSPVVMPFGKAFEGFVTRLAMQLSLVTEEAIKQSAANITIGQWLIDIRDNLPDRRRYEFVTASMNSAWQSRNKAMHADPQVPMVIRSLDEAHQEIIAIIRGMHKAHEVFIKQNVALASKPKIVDTPPGTKAEASPPSSETRDRFDGVDIERLATKLAADGFTISRQQPGRNTIWEVQTADLQIYCSAKRSGRITIRGSRSQEFISRYYSLLQPVEQGTPAVVREDELFAEPENTTLPGWIGVDESGKGDVFGPLVVAGVYVSSEQAQSLIKLGVRDSKTLSDTAIGKLSDQIKATCIHHYVLVVEPREYNVLYERLQNLNHLLAQKHAEVITRLHKDTAAPRAISDQFGDKRLLEEALQAQGVTVDLEQRPRAEDNIAVAAASILARAAFVAWLEDASQQLGINLPPGVAPITVEAGRCLIAKHGRKALVLYVKAHFRTVQEILASA